MAKADKLLLGAVAFCLLALISAQLAGVFDWPLPWRSGRAGEALPAALPAAQEEAGLFAVLEVAVAGGYSLEQAYLLRNGQIAADFREGRARLTVYPGDELAVDCRAYSGDIVFELENLSRNLREELLTKRIKTGKSVEKIGLIIFK